MALLVVLPLILAIATALMAAQQNIGNISLPGCPTKCGSIDVPYPFGFLPGCYRPGFQLTCNTTYNITRLFIGSSLIGIEVTSISEKGNQLLVGVPYIVSAQDGISRNASWATALVGTPYTISSQYNNLTATGCGVVASLLNPDTGATVASCVSFCGSEGIDTSSCNLGFGCCWAIIPPGLRTYSIKLETLETDIWGGGVAAVMANDNHFVENFEDSNYVGVGTLKGSTRVWVVLDWVISDAFSCNVALQNLSSYACLKGSRCIDMPEGYICHCGSELDDGNPYVPNSCPGECSAPYKYCNGICTYTPGNVNCYPNKKTSVALAAIIGVSTGLGLILLLLGGVILHKRLKQRIRQKNNKKNFHKNRGLLLQQMIASNEIAHERVKIFSLEDLEEATNKFDETRILGSGGYGTVYKGLLSDQRVVAIKKSKIVEQTEIEQFINEVFILSIINHRNVVKLFGCCLEDEVPLLVYEFISNGSLSDRLHLEEHKSSLSWDDRLRIASETAGALAYLHSAASISIFHRDVKTANILLDENFSAKVSDFGASRSLPVDKTRVFTGVQGTFGYLDPEYYHTGELTQKSDVYSFGVILVELLTGKMPNSVTNFEEGRNLCMSFLSSLRENRLVEILEPRVIEGAPTEELDAFEGALIEELDAVAKLAEACLNLRGEDRPTMKEVAETLESLVKTKKQKQKLI